MEKVARWTMGPVSDAGFECLATSIRSFSQLYDTKLVICHNCKAEKLTSIVKEFAVELIDQTPYLSSTIKPKGVAWKLYPPRIAPDAHEIHIDNDIVFENKIEEIDHFFDNDCTLLLEAASRNYGRFDRHVPPGYCINSGIFGMPPGFNFDKYINFYVHTEWEENATGKHASSKTFDEQGLVAFALLNYRKSVIIPDTSVTNCENNLISGRGLHFIGLNRDEFHLPYRLYKSQKARMFL